MAANLTSCSRCGAPLLMDSAPGHCPACLLSLGLSTVAGERSRNRAGGVLPVHPAARLPGEVPSRFFADYELLEEIARGGMGIVYRARQVSLNRPVALKMILDGPLASRGFIERFHLEAESAARLNHPNIVPIYEIGEHEGRHFFSMELLEAGDLRKRMADFELPREKSAATEQRQKRIARVMATVAGAVHHAHERGILHRDLKPANILFDKEGEPHVTDFGLAKLVSEENFLTQSGTVLGTPAYMAPEQASAEPAQLTTAADIYSLGAILYHLLAGRPPFQAATALDTMRQVIEVEPAPPDQVNQAVDRDLATITLKCLEKDPARRYASARALARDLSSWLEGETIAARPATRAESFSRWCRRKPALAALGATVILLLLTLLGTSITAALRIERARKTAVIAQQKAIGELWKSYLDQARARRWSGRSGRRFESLRAITNAAAIRKTIELRNEAIAALAVSDMFPIGGEPRTKQKTDRLAIDFARNRYLLSDSQGVTIRRLDNGAELFRVSNGSSRIELATFSADGSLVLLNYFDGSDRVWNVAEGRFIWESKEGLESTSLSSDSQNLAYSTTNRQLVILSFKHPEHPKTIALPTLIWGLCWNPDGASIAAMGEKQVLVIGLETAKVTAHFPFDRQPISIVWHPDGKRLVEGGDEQIIHLLDVPAAKEIAVLEGHLGDVTALRCSPDGTLLASDSWDGTLRLWDLASLKNVMTVSAGPEGIEFAPDGRRLSVYSWSESRIDLFEILTNAATVQLILAGQQRPHSGCALLFGPGGDWLASSEDTALQFWNVESARPIARWENRPSDTLQMLPEGSGLFGWTPDGFYRLVMCPTNASRESTRLERFIPEVPPSLQSQCPPEFLTKFRAERLPERSGASRDGRTLALAYKDRCYVFDMNRGALQAVTGSQALMKYVSVSPDARWVATGGWHNRNVKIWDAATGRQEAELPTETMPSVLFSPDGQWLVSSTGGEYRFWHTGDWRPAHRIARSVNGDLPGPMAFSADGKLLAVANSTRNIHLVSPNTGELLAELAPLPDNEIVALALSADGSELALTRVGAPPELWHLGRIRKDLAALGLDW
jgi:eukaryotic-like serine/threonine-protein kinase